MVPGLKERLNSLSRSCQRGFNRDDLDGLLLPFPPINDKAHSGNAGCHIAQGEKRKGTAGKVRKLKEKLIHSFGIENGDFSEEIELSPYLIRMHKQNR
jgi:hypothetical protein